MAGALIKWNKEVSLTSTQNDWLSCSLHNKTTESLLASIILVVVLVHSKWRHADRCACWRRVGCCYPLLTFPLPNNPSPLLQQHVNKRQMPILPTIRGQRCTAIDKKTKTAAHGRSLILVHWRGQTQKNWRHFFNSCMTLHHYWNAKFPPVSGGSWRANEH